jgi:hypothetical protein
VKDLAVFLPLAAAIRSGWKMAEKGADINPCRQHLDAGDNGYPDINAAKASLPTIAAVMPFLNAIHLLANHTARETCAKHTVPEMSPLGNFLPDDQRLSRDMEPGSAARPK